MLLVLGGGQASAEPPVQISDHLTDDAAVLGDGAAAVREALESQAANSDVTLHAVFVSSFDTQGDADWLEQTAQRSALEASDVLLAVAVGPATYDYGWWMDDSSPLSEAPLCHSSVMSAGEANIINRRTVSAP